MHDPDDRMATAAYQPEPRAAAAARRFVRDTLRTWRLGGPEPGRAGLIDDAVLLTSELVTNAVVHAGTPVQVTCRLAESAVEVVVLDRHPVQLVPGRPRSGADTADRTSGRGLLLPAELASSWGVTYARTAKAVWFRLGLDPDPPPAAPAGPGSPGTAVAEPPPPAAPAPAPQSGARPAQPVPAAVLAPTVPAVPVPAPAGGQVVPVGGAAFPVGGAAGRVGGTAASAGGAAGAAGGAVRPVGGAAVPAGPAGGAAGAAVPAGGAVALAGPLPVLASRALGRIGYEELLSHTAEAARAMLAADAAYLLAPGEDGELRVRAAAGAGPSGAADLGPLAPGTGAAEAAARDLAEAAKSLVTVPLVAEGRVTGVLAAAAAEPGQFSDQDSARLQALADRAAPALEEARLGEADRAAEARARFLSEAARLLDGSLSRERIAELTAQLVVPRLADWCALLLPGPGGALTPAYLMHADAARTDALAWLLGHAPPPPSCPGPEPGPGEPGLDPDPEPGHDPGPGPARPAGRPGVRWPLTRPGPAGARDGDQEPDGAASLAADGAWLFPLTTSTHPLGLLAVAGVAGARPPAEAELIAGLARRSALALTAVRPADSPPPGRSAPPPVPRPDPPRIPGVDLAVTHEHPAGCAETGGDFCDVFPAGPGRWRFALADVCGTGREAAAISGLAR
ncbi:MAG TPA: GAF domain-containing protein, partial [Streptosporangiaceae bacterium]|nr:GAF domain-containing protein [Streptosporangiaceae bacterium]